MYSIKFSEAQVKEIIKLYVEEVKSSKEIANRFKVHDTTIRRLLKKNNLTIRKSIDLTGRKINKLLVIKRLDTRKDKRVNYLCLCDCGTEKIISSSGLGGTVKSCGCAILEKHKREARDQSAFNVWNYTYKDGLSFEKFKELSQLNCYYCGSSPSNSMNVIVSKNKLRVSQGTFTYNGLDRIDSDKDHSEENIVPCCKTCNWMKNNLHRDEFMEHITKIYKFHNKEN